MSFYNFSTFDPLPAAGAPDGLLPDRLARRAPRRHGCAVPGRKSEAGERPELAAGRGGRGADTGGRKMGCRQGPHPGAKRKTSLNR